VIAWTRVTARRIAVGTTITAAYAMGSYVHLQREGVSTGEWTLASLLVVSVVGGAAAGLIHDSIRRGDNRGWRYYVSWIAGATIGFGALCLAAIQRGEPWHLILVAPAAGTIAGLGWAIFMRKVDD
jgi:hypothetical protein